MKTLTRDMQRSINAQTKIDEADVVAEVEARGWEWEQLDFPNNPAKRPEGCVLIDGRRAVLVEVKRAVIGGRSSDGTVMLTEFDADLPGSGVKEFPAIPPSVDRQLDHAAEKFADLTKDRPEFAGLPYVVFYYASDFVTLDLVDRKMPTRRAISGVAYVVRGRCQKEALQALGEDELERRINENDTSGLPDPNEVEWRFVANPYALRPVPRAFAEVCLIGWPDDLAWPDSITSNDEARAKAMLAQLGPAEILALDTGWWCFGRVDSSTRALSPIEPLMQLLVRRGLAHQSGEHQFELTTNGLLCALVKAAPRP